MFDVSNRSVVVTGASRGIGKGIARVFARAGARVTIAAREREALEQAAAELAADGAEVFAFPADVTAADDLESLIAAAAERHGGVDILCANAGIFPMADLETITTEQIDAVLDCNVKGTILAVRAAIPELERSGRGRVVLTSSITGPITGLPGWSHYGASKAAQLGFMRSAAIELSAKGITVNAVVPGNVVTEGLEELGQDYMDSMARMIPVKRLGTVEDIGHAALFLASDEAGYVNGQAIVVDGGQVLPETLADD
jgi:3-oxoacyl-[acyl-carrier protein] reductase